MAIRLTWGVGLNKGNVKKYIDKAVLDIEQAIAELESQEPVAWVQDVEFEQLPEFAFSWVKTRLHDKPLYTHPPQRTEPEPVQVSPLEFVEMVMEKEHLIGKPIFWAEWPNKENPNDC